MLKKALLTIVCCVVAVLAVACSPEKAEVPAAPVDDSAAIQKDQVIKEAKDILSQNEEPEKMVALLQAHIQSVGQDGAEIMISGLEQLQESHLAEYTDLMLADGIQQSLAEIDENLDDPNTYATLDDKELAGLLEKLRKSGYRFENFEGAWYPIVDYSGYKEYAAYASQELKDYIALLAIESDKVSMKDAAIVIDSDELAQRLILAEGYVVKYGASPRIGRVKEAYAGYLWNMLAGSNNTPIYDWETKEIKPEIRKAYEKFSRENPDLVSTKAVRNWLGILREGKYVFDENTMYQSLDSIYGDTLKDMGIEADYK